MTTPYPSRRHLLASAAGLTAAVVLPHAARAAAPAAATVFIDSSAADLAGVKRVAIAAFVVEFQTADKASKDGFHMSRLHVSDDTDAFTRWQNADPALLQQITDTAYAQARQQLAVKGMEVVDTATVTGNAAWQKIQAKAGFDSGANWDNADGLSVICGPAGLAPYMPYALELGNYECNPHPKLMHKENMARNPSHTRQVGVWELPGLEIDLAKSLDAAVVKLWCVVNFSELSAGRKISDMSFFDDHGSDMSGVQTTYSAEAGSFVRLRQDQTRISFRLPSSSKKMGYKVKNAPADLMAPPRDGDVVVALGKPVGVGPNLYTITEGSSGAKGVAGAMLGMLNSKQTFYFDATLNDPVAYAAHVTSALSGAQQALINTAFPA